MDENYSKILGKLVKISGVGSDEIDRRVEAKRAKLSGLISREGALQVIAAELGISFDDEKLKIGELLPGMRKVNFSGKVVTIYPIRTFKTKDGGEGKVANLFIADDTGNIKIVLWDTNHIGMLENEEIKEGVSIEIIGGGMRDNEVHMGSFAELKLSDEIFDDVKVSKPVREKEIVEFNLGDSIRSRAFIVQTFEPKFFEVNKTTGRKLTDEEKANGVEVEKRALINIVLDDGSETIRAVLFHEKLKEIGLTDLENEAILNQQRENLLGKELIFLGNVRRNSYFNNSELIVDAVEDLDLDRVLNDF